MRRADNASGRSLSDFLLKPYDKQMEGIGIFKRRGKKRREKKRKQ